jgi:hypothetical protein
VVVLVVTWLQGPRQASWHGKALPCVHLNCPSLECGMVVLVVKENLKASWHGKASTLPRVHVQVAKRYLEFFLSNI